MAATTETTAGNAPPGNPLERMREAFNRLGIQQKIGFMVALAAIVAIVVGSVLWSQQPDWKVLFSNLSEKDGGAIVTLLEQQNIPHRMSDNGSIQVAANRVHEIRLKMASQGLPRGGMVGFELMENQKFGISQFAEQVNYQRGLEGELARTIMSIGSVQSARVHLAIPKPSVFVRDEQKPTASVMLNLYPGRTLDGGQVAGITHLVSSSVPQLPMANVTVIDQNGALLSQLKSKLTEAGLDPAQNKYIREVEDSIIKRIEEILKPVLGPENYKVQVAADIDFSQTEQTAESYRPNNTPETSSIRSQQKNETASVNQAAGGVPGALTNQPPVPATAPLTQPATGTTPTQPGKPVPPQGQVDAAGVTAPLNAAGQPINTSKNSTINYEVDKTVRYTKQAMGAIRRLSTAVVVNHRKDVGKDGKPTTKAIPEAEMKQINELVREAMGFSKERGDTLSIANAPFTASEPADHSLPIWKDPENISYAKDIFKYLIIGGILALLYLKIIQPSLKTMFPPPKEEDSGTAETVTDALGNIIVTGEDGEDVVAIDHYAVKVQKTRDIAQADPKAVANIIKEWMGANAG
ncbi:flagellar basal body M-ring protein FliF [Dechloromonas sp. TW-R-39-2]|uniref:flagellar basal-body MS-ring/collar protein FliF n=1 Tax=Dechloromonas sp. TW-R-39-2 TaxID=2654218 RepID=UPI00193DB3C0|nr:flagellar basal-body MS-ring/collar protein FliF [Dechloromonas sp. TW-R-39-2]QRM20490.1 flagellar basal body M-ring protein FliF [Dechloromonas sp. TW-R-39-2]